MLTSKFENILSFIQNKKVLVLTHHLVDVDALASMICFKFLMKELKHDRVYFHCSTLTKSTKEFFSLFSEQFGPFDIKDNLGNLSEFDVLIVLDTNNLNHLIVPDIKESSLLMKPIIFIDHHPTTISTKNNYNLLSIIDDKYNSTSEIVYELITHYIVEIPLPYLYLIAAGIITDTGFFKHANKRVFRSLARLLEKEGNYQEIVNLLDHNKDISEKIAQIKGVQRVKLYRMQDKLVGISHVSNFRAKVAVNLLNLGFDVAIVYSKVKKGNFITARAKKYVCLETGLNLNELLEKISNGRGGGHDGAASVFIEKNLEDKIAELLALIQEILIK
ncbi:MAG: hypothetical protein EU532_06180 [Promethearchaeota archaeon]|nr:MAG: hypothetical protein EU532_06180 [Candidatus Lokiarchaeota archaeon]